jgi:hypothetical protein
MASLQVAVPGGHDLPRWGVAVRIPSRARRDKAKLCDSVTEGAGVANLFEPLPPLPDL